MNHCITTSVFMIINASCVDVLIDLGIGVCACECEFQPF